MNLSEIADLATAIALVFLVIQLYLQSKDQKNQAIVRLFDEMETIDFRRKMSFLYQHKPEDLLPSKLSEAEHEMLYEVIAHFESLGFRVKKGSGSKAGLHRGLLGLGDPLCSTNPAVHH